MEDEKRLIDANALLKIYKGWIPQIPEPEYEGDRRGIESAIAVLEDAPTVDAVVLPCEAGRTVYVLDGSKIVSMTINHYEFHRHTGLWAVLLDSVVASKKKTVVNVKAL